jgi:hypothetical protein
MHWAFALKYWSLSIKIELISKDQDVDSKNKMFWILMLSGIILNMFQGTIYAWQMYYYAVNSTAKILLIVA